MQSSTVEVSVVTFSMAKGSSTSDNVISLSCSETAGCKNIVVDQVNITSSIPSKMVSATCSNAQGKSVNVLPTIPLSDYYSPRRILLQEAVPANINGVFNVVDFGATGNGFFDDSQAFLEAWGAACGSTEGTPTVVIPTGKTFLLNPITFHGPCKSNTLLVQVFGNIVAPTSVNTWEGLDKGSWILFTSVNGLIIDGGGTGQVNGQGAAWWDNCNSLRIHMCNSFKVRGMKLVDSAKGHIGVSNCNDGDLSSVVIVAPDDSPNTDGIDISSSIRIRINDSTFSTGDDCIAINGGCSFINITNVLCGPGHGISVGSLGENGSYDTVEEVNVQNCFFNATQNGVRIKTWQGGSGYARKINFQNITLNIVENPIVINQYYCPMKPCNNESSTVEVSDVTFSMVKGSSTSDNVISLSCSETAGCKNIVLDQINITSSIPSKMVSATCSNAHGRSINALAKESEVGAIAALTGSQVLQILRVQPGASDLEGLNV
ncbi:probable polygalacturonase At3g15720 [Malania oleifera]|uniref:probable polygalacturonase At3g15720 n=1 Tax=Malania oleifera TaxID=397392 RepID=UPI0025AE286D|nr:probable polygalacturonase At3g15720 [Malania oleifera]